MLRKFIVITFLFVISVVFFIPISANAAIEDYVYNNLPSKYSSKAEGFCSPVKNQIGGTCWAHSSMAAFESKLLKEGLYSTDYSPYELVNWAKPDENGNGWYEHSGGGNFSVVPMGYLASWEGPIGTNGEKSNVGATSIIYLTHDEGAESPELIKSMIMRNGAVVTNICTSKDVANSSVKSEIVNYYTPKSLTTKLTNHSITVVGWDDNYSKENFKYTPKNDGAWFCKNSWGNYNSLNGYFWVSYEDRLIFSRDYSSPAYSIMEVQKITNKDYIYQNEKYGTSEWFTYSSKGLNNGINYPESKKVTYMNVFDFSKHGNKLDKIVFSTKSKNAKYICYYIPLDKKGIPIKNKDKWIKLGDGNVDYKGYICCDFKDLVVENKKAAIGVEINTENCTKVANTIGSTLKSVAANKEWLFKDPAAFGECFFYAEGVITDLKQHFLNKTNIDEIGCHFVIKAITNDTIDPNVPGDVNLDGETDINDATVLQKYIASIIDLSENQLNNSLMLSKQDSVDINTVTIIQRYIAHMFF